MTGSHTKHAHWKPGSSFTYAEITASFQTLITYTSDIAIFFIFNSLNQDIEVSFPNEDGTTAEFILPARTAPSYDAMSNGLLMCAGSIRVRHIGVAPTSGRISVFGA